MCHSFKMKKLNIDDYTIDKVFHRYKTITKAINEEFWNQDIWVYTSFFVGSYGRHIAIKTSDIDILVELPADLFDRVNNLIDKSQSRLLEIVKKVITEKYSTSNVKQNGQVVIINFTDGIKFEILPAFKKHNGSYIYPDTNKGGKWRSTDPQNEQKYMHEANIKSNNLLYDTYKYIRHIRDQYFSQYQLKGIVIDTFVYHAIGEWKYSLDKKYILNNKYYEPKDYFEHLFYYYNNCILCTEDYIFAIATDDKIPYKSSKECLGKVLKYIKNI